MKISIETGEKININGWKDQYKWMKRSIETDEKINRNGGKDQ